MNLNHRLKDKIAHLFKDGHSMDALADLYDKTRGQIEAVIREKLKEQDHEARDERNEPQARLAI